MQDSTSNPAFNVVAVIIAMAVFASLVFATRARAGNYEEVTVTNVRNTTILSCPQTGVISVQAAGTSGSIAIPQVANAGIQPHQPGVPATAKTDPRPYRHVPGSVPASAANPASAVPGGTAGGGPGCTEKTAYVVSYRRKNGATGEILTQSYVAGKTTIINFCPGPQNNPMERPC